MYNLEYFTKENFINKLDTAIQIRYGNEKNDTDGKQKRAFYEDFRRKYPDVFDISQAVRSWRSFSKNNIGRLPQVTQLMQLCDVLDCDIDYFLTSQEKLRKEIANASDVTGLKYKSIDLLNTISQRKSPLAKMALQFLDLVLSSKDIFNDIITSLACIVFHLDDDESDQIVSTYDNNADEDSRCFLDETNLEEYYLNYGGKYYSDSTRMQYFDSMLLLEINKRLERLKKQEKEYRNSYNGNLEVVILEENYENEKCCILEDDNKCVLPLKDIDIKITRQNM